MDASQLAQYHQQIEDIDNAILELLASRLAITTAIALIKKQNNLPASQPESEQTILLDKKQKAEKFGMDSAFILQLYTLILANAREEQAFIIGIQNTNTSGPSQN